MAETRYTFEGTPELDRGDADAARELAKLLPGGEALRELREAVSDALAEAGSPGGAGDAPAGRAGAVEVTGRGVAREGDDPFGGVRVRIFLRLGGDGGEAILETGIEEARTLASRIIGVDREKLAASDLLTHLEEGVLAFFVERLLFAVGEKVSYAAGLLPIVLTAVGSESFDPDRGGSGPSAWYSLSGRALLAETALPWRLLVPRKALESCRGAYDSSEGAALHNRLAREDLAGRLGHARVDLTGRLGAVRLSAADVERLERNDIILFDGAGCAFDEEVLGGTIRLAPAGSRGANGSVVASVVEDGDSLTVKVEEVVTGADWDEGERSGDMMDQENDREELEGEENAAAGGGEDEGGGAEAEDAGSAGEKDAPEEAPPPPEEGGALAADVPLLLKVELGRMRTTLRELSRLSAGAVLELRKDPAAPVSLVVEDRTVGRGELVKVEGELGVRILSLGE